MEYDDKLIEEAVLALLATFSFDNGNPVNKNKSIWLTAEGLERGRQIADRLFGVGTQGEHVSESDT